MIHKTRRNSLLEHQFMVAFLFKHFAELEKIKISLKVFDLVMNHDALESITSDLPWPVKNFTAITKKAWKELEHEIINYTPELRVYTDGGLRRELTTEQHDLFKTCDTLDLWIFVQEEISYGNNSKDIKKVESNCLNIFRSIQTKFPSVENFLKSFNG